MLEVLTEDYMRTAAAKGASSYAMLFHHALKNAGVLRLRTMLNDAASKRNLPVTVMESDH